MVKQCFSYCLTAPLMSLYIYEEQEARLKTYPKTLPNISIDQIQERGDKG